MNAEEHFEIWMYGIIWINIFCIFVLLPIIAIAQPAGGNDGGSSSTEKTSKQLSKVKRT